MTVSEQEIPILEYDPDPSAVITPGHELPDLRLPSKAVFAFLRDAVDRYAQSHGVAPVAFFESATKDFPVYIVDDRGEQICMVQAPVGAPAATQILDWLIAHGVQKIISAGSCGVLTDFPENVFLVPSRALRDEGTSFHYVSPSRWIDANPAARSAIGKALRDHGHAFTEVTTWTTDGFFRETRSKVERRRAEGCSVVEMECAALAACAQMRGAIWGELLYTADSLAGALHDARDWGHASVEYALKLCLDAIHYV